MKKGNENVASVNAVVGETNDGFLNDIRGRHVTKEDVLSAIKNAKSGGVEEGVAGARTGTVCYGYKGGIGTSTRKLPKRLGGYKLGFTWFGLLLQLKDTQITEKSRNRYLLFPPARINILY